MNSYMLKNVMSRAPSSVLGLLSRAVVSRTEARRFCETLAPALRTAVAGFSNTGTEVCKTYAGVFDGGFSNTGRGALRPGLRREGWWLQLLEWAGVHFDVRTAGCGCRSEQGESCWEAWGPALVWCVNEPVRSCLRCVAGLDFKFSEAPLVKFSPLFPKEAVVDGLLRSKRWVHCDVRAAGYASRSEQGCWLRFIE
jgi:hypothetical protein